MQGDLGDGAAGGEAVRGVVRAGCEGNAQGVVAAVAVTQTYVTNVTYKDYSLG